MVIDENPTARHMQRSSCIAKFKGEIWEFLFLVFLGNILLYIYIRRFYRGDRKNHHTW
ncbi:hypothetical protein Scep_002106 [Stephania cephalantha]|uniref:Uncharacterized protein n=1 Tax=Stephania cephalantha TaxID=152367 RepID=A0AAP0Q4D4_9MAGN